MPVLAADTATLPPAVNTARGALTTIDLAFIKSASSLALVQIIIAEMTMRKSSSDNFRKYATKMLTDYKRAKDDLEKLAKAHGVPITTELDHFQTLLVEGLEKWTGLQFEKQYILSQQSELNRIGDVYRNYARTGNDQNLKQYAANLSLVIQGHKMQINNINNTKYIQ